MFMGPVFASELMSENVAEDTKLDSILEAYYSKLHKQKTQIVIFALFTFILFVTTTLVFFAEDYQINFGNAVFVALVFTANLALIAYFITTRVTKNRLIKLIVHRLDQTLTEKKNIEKIMLQLSLNVDKQVQERVKKINLEKSSAFRVMQEAIKSKKSQEISENTLKKVLNKLSLTLEASGIGLWNWDIAEDRLWLDDKAHELFALEPKSFTGNLENLLNLSVEKSTKLKPVFAEAKIKGGFKNLELTLTNNQEQDRKLLLKGKVFYGLKNQPIFMTGVCWDITEDKLAQDVVNKFFSLSVDLFCVADRNGYFANLSPVWSEVLGYSMSELYSHPFMYFVHPRDRKKTQAEYQVLVSQPHRTVNFENRYKCKNGQYRHLLWNAVSLPDESLIYAIARDITDYKKKTYGIDNFVDDQRASRIEFSI